MADESTLAGGTLQVALTLRKEMGGLAEQTRKDRQTAAEQAEASTIAASKAGDYLTAVEQKVETAEGIEARVGTIGAVETRTTALEEVTVPAIAARATDLEDRADTLEAAKASLEGRATTLESRATTVEGRADAVEGRATALEGRATTVEGRATALEGRAGDLETASGLLAGRATALEDRAGELEEDRDLLDGRMTAADERQNAFDDRANALEGRATVVEAATADLETAAATLAGRATTLEGRADGLDAASATLAGRATALEGRADDVEAAATTLAGRATAVEGRATAVEGRATALEGRADDVEAAAAALADRATSVEGRATTVEGRATVLEATAAQLATRTRRQDQRALSWSMFVPASLGLAAAAAVTVGSNGRVVEAAVAQSAYEARVAPLEAAATEVAGRATALEGRATTVEAEAAALRRATAGVAGQLSWSMWVPQRPGVREIKIGGNGQEITALAGAADVAALEARVTAARKTAQFFIWLPKQQFPQSVYYVGNNGRQLAFDPGGAGGSGDGTPLLKINYLATLGSNYTTNPTISVWDTTSLHGGSLWGQSFANAGLRPGESVYSATPRDPDWIWMPSAGLAPGGSNFDAFVPLYSDQSGSTGETILPEMLHHVLAAIYARTGERRPIVGRVHAHSGQPYYALMRGTNVLNQWRQGVRNCVIAAKAIGKNYVEAYCCVLHGEADHNVPWWQMVQNMLQLSREMTAAARAETGQTQPVVLILQFPNRSANSGTVRQSGPNIAYRWLCDHYPHLFVGASPTYGIRQHETDSHPVVDGYRMHGRLFAPAVVGAIAGTGWVGTRAMRFWETGPNIGQIEVNVPLGGSLVRDESGTLVGYDPDPESPHYIGPPPEGQEATGRDGGIRHRDLVDGNNGIVSSVVSGNLINVTAYRNWGPKGSNILMGGCRPTGASIAGNNEEMGRTVFRGDTAYTLTDSAELCHHWLEPFELRW